MLLAYMHFLYSLLALFGISVGNVAVAVPYYHIVVVVEENHSYAQLTEQFPESVPYITQTLRDEGANFTHAFGEEHKREGNYLWLFSGSRQNIAFDDPVPVGPFATPNLATSLFAAGKTF